MLVVLDDVTDYKRIEPYLPPQESRFKLLATTRLQLGRSFQTLEIKVLSEDAALNLLRSLTDVDRINNQLKTAKQLCHWLGYLPLGLELIGRYLAQKPDLSLTELQKRLDSKRLNARALQQLEPGMTATLNITAAFELSWQQLDSDAQTLCYLLGLFALAPIAWNWVEPCFPDRDPEDIEDLRDRLIRSSFLQRSSEGTYSLHQLIREFFQAKAIEYSNQDEVDELKRSICRVMAEISRTIPEVPTLTDIAQLTPVIPHLESIAHHLSNFYTDKDLIWMFVGVARFYEGQGLYGQAEPWRCECVRITTARLGADHPDVAIILNNLAELYRSQGRYTEADPLYVRSLDICERQLGPDHLDVALCLHNLAELYCSQGRYTEAEPLYVRSLNIWEQQLGPDHPNAAIILNNLAKLYHFQRRYTEAEPLYVRSLNICEQQLEPDHPNAATSLNNLAELYRSQGRYTEAEPLYVRSLNICERQLGPDHPNVALSLNNLAKLFYSQEQYGKAEPLYLRSLQIFEQKLGANHPNTVKVRSNLEDLREAMREQGRSNE